MHLKKNGKSAAWMWALCTICILFSRICFDNGQADPYLAYQETAPGSAGHEAAVLAFGAGHETRGFAFRAVQESVDFTSGAVRTAAVSAFRAFQEAEVSVFNTTQKGIPAQAYVPTGQTQGNIAFILRKTAQRINSRYSTNNAADVLPAGVFSDTFFSGQTARSLDGSCEVFSNTVILHYIHRQDGEK